MAPKCERALKRMNGARWAIWIRSIFEFLARGRHHHDEGLGEDGAADDAIHVLERVGGDDQIELAAQQGLRMTVRQTGPQQQLAGRRVDALDDARARGGGHRIDHAHADGGPAGQVGLAHMGHQAVHVADDQRARRLRAMPAAVSLKGRWERSKTCVSGSARSGQWLARRPTA
jgi:hypothetical protein